MKKLLSYLFPVRLKEYHSPISGDLEINLIAGRKVLDTHNSNYSYGTLQQLLHKALEISDFNESVKTVLVLGMGGGSIVPTIREDFQSDALITLVELDPEMVRIARTEFDIDRFSGIHIEIADAAAFMEKNAARFDVIIMDVFVVNEIPEVFTQKAFVLQLAEALNSNGTLIYNTLRNTMKKEKRQAIEHWLAEAGLNTSVLEKVMWSNDVILARKPDNV